MNTKIDRIALSKKSALFGIPRELLKIVTGGGGVIIQVTREAYTDGGVIVTANGIGTSPSTP